MCNRQVHNLNGMTDQARVAFLQSCSGEVCVSYSLPAAAMAAAMAVAAMTAPGMAFAQDAQTVQEIEIGGIKDLANIEYVQDAGDAAIPELPVVYDDNQASGKTKVAAATVPASPAGK